MYQSMSKTGILALILICLSILAYFLIKDNSANKTTFISADRGFAVKDINKVTKIVIKHVKLQPLVFTNNGNGWKINGKYEVDPAVFVHVEKVLTNISLLYVPPSNSSSTILNSIKNNGIQVDIYQGGDKPSKILHIGSDTPKNDGSYMVLGGSKQPYAMHLPGLAGGIRSRFEQPLENYRNKFLFQYPLRDIKQVTIEYPKSQSHSFKISNSNVGLKIEPLIVRNSKYYEINQTLIKSYLANFENLGAEKLINSYPMKDSIISTTPACILELHDTKGKIVRHKYYTYDDFENGIGSSRSPGDIRFQNRMFVFVDSLDFYVVQNRVFGNIFRGYDEFLNFSK